MRVNYLIGIDPGVDTGVALWNGKDILFAKSMSFWEAVELLEEYSSMIPGAIVYIEDPNQNKPTFDRGESKKAMQKISQNVGSNKRDAQLLIQKAQALGFNVKKVKPTSSKWSKADLKLYTKIATRTNQHVRDAIKLIYGR